MRYYNYNKIKNNNHYGFIYITTNKINHKKYIGKCVISRHDSKEYLGSGTIFLRALNKYGKENFVRKIIDYADNNKQLCEKEKYWIKIFNATASDKFYNIAEGGEGYTQEMIDIYASHPVYCINNHTFYLNAKIASENTGDFRDSIFAMCERLHKDKNLINKILNGKYDSRNKKYKRDNDYCFIEESGYFIFEGLKNYRGDICVLINTNNLFSSVSCANNYKKYIKNNNITKEKLGRSLSFETYKKYYRKLNKNLEKLNKKFNNRVCRLDMFLRFNRIYKITENTKKFHQNEYGIVCSDDQTFIKFS